MDYLSNTEGRTIKWIEDHSEGLAFIYFAQGKPRVDRITKITRRREMMSLGDQRAD